VQAFPCTTAPMTTGTRSRRRRTRPPASHEKAPRSVEYEARAANATGLHFPSHWWSRVSICASYGYATKTVRKTVLFIAHVRSAADLRSDLGSRPQPEANLLPPYSFVSIGLFCED
jgi:hypothetical protein